MKEREEIKYNNIKKAQKMINFDHTTTENTKEQNKNWSQILDTLCRILIIGGFGSRKINSMFNLISQQPDIDKIYLYAKDPCEAKSPFLINKWESTDSKHFNDSKAFIKCSYDMDNIYKNFEEHKPDKKLKIFIVFDDMITDMLSNLIQF